MLTPIENIDQV